MKHITIFILGIFLIFNSCTSRSDQNKNEETVSNENGISEVDFDESFQAIKGNVVQDTSIRYFEGEKANSDEIPELLTQNNWESCSSVPTKISDLNSGAGFFIYKFSSSMSASASAFGFEGSIGKKELLIVQDYVRYKNISCGDSTRKIGIGLRCFIHVKALKGKLGGSLSSIAASVELDRASGEFNIVSLGFGIGGDVIGDLPTQGEYNVDNFGSLAIVFNNILKTLKNDSDLSISPVELP